MHLPRVVSLTPPPFPPVGLGLRYVYVRVADEVEGVCGVLALLPANHCLEKDLPSKEHELLVSSALCDLIHNSLYFYLVPRYSNISLNTYFSLFFFRFNII